MQKDKELHPIIRYPFYVISILYYLTLHQVFLIIAKIYGIIERRVLAEQVKKIIGNAVNAFGENNYDEAIVLCHKCIDKIPVVYKSIFKEYNHAVLYLGSLYRIKGNLIEAERYLKEASSIIDENEYDGMVLNIYKGDFYSDKGELKKAERSYLKAYEKLSDNKQSDMYKNLCYSICTLYQEMGQFELAQKYLTESYVDNPEDFEKTFAEIELLKSQGKFAEGEIKAKSALNLLNEANKDDINSARLLKQLSELSFRQKHHNEALSYANRALAIYGNEHPEYGECLTAVGIAQLKLKQYSGAKESLSKALQLHLAVYGKISQKYLVSLQNLALLFGLTGANKESEILYEESMEIYTELINNHFKQMTYDERISLATIYTSYQTQIFHYISNDNNYSDKFLNKVFDFRLNTKVLLLEKTKKSNMIDNAFEKIRQLLKEDEAVIETVRFVESDETETGNIRNVFFIISSKTQNAPILLTVITTLEKEKNDYELYLKNIKNKSVDFYSFENYWSFLTPELQGKKNIILSQSGMYQYINVNTLFNDSGIFLADEYNIKYYNDLRNLINGIEENEILPKKALIMANPTFYNEKVYSRDKTIEQFLPAINETKEEAITISTILEENNCRATVYLSEAVTKSNLENISEYQLLHIATHGYFNNIGIDSSKSEEMMKKSGLFLSHPFFYSSEVNDLVLSKEGFLSSYDIVNTEMQNLDLVILSACKSGLGISTNMGVSYGFIQTFFTAGVGNIIISLWEVEDKITTEFMAIFYTAWMIEKNKHKAFLKAQNEIKNKFRQPLYWGGFVMYHK